MNSPLDILLPYQRRWVDDAARFKIGMWSRQTGKSFASACEMVRDSMAKPGGMWVILSAGERQALEFMEKVKAWTQVFELALEGYVEDRAHGEAVLKSAEVRVNGARIIALPANPATARGYTANLCLDEFAFHDDPDGIWRAIFPSVSNPLKGELKLRIVSTPNGKANKFYDLWTKNPTYSKHKVTIHDAVAEGLPVDIEALRAGLDDPEGWAQEYECEFIDASSVLLPYDLIAPCESDEATESGEFRADAPKVESYCGVDIGRKRDLTVCWELVRVGDVQWTREVRVLEKMPFRDQMDVLRPILQRARRVCIDATGIGAMMAEEFTRELGSYKIEECQFTAAFKSDIFTGLRRRFEDKGLRIPVSRVIREDLHGLQRQTTSSGNIRYVAPHNDDGHCDRATALALAVHAAEDPGTAPKIFTAGAGAGRIGGRW